MLKPIAISSWALALFGLVAPNWLPISRDGRIAITLLLLVFALYLLVYFHWLWPRYRNLIWMNLVPTLMYSFIVTGINYVLGSVVNVAIIYVIIVANAAKRLGRRLAILACGTQQLRTPSICNKLHRWYNHLKAFNRLSRGCPPAQLV